MGLHFTLPRVTKTSASIFALLIAAITAAPIARADDSAATGRVRGYFDRAGELVMQALSLVGVRYRFGGNTPDGGLDCSGFVNYVFREAEGKKLPRNAADMSKVGSQVDAAELEPGDLVFFNTRKRPNSHVGIYLGEQRFIHAPSRGGGVEVVNMSDRYWRTRFNGARRVEP